jgi:hypothetical protein
MSPIDIPQVVGDPAGMRALAGLLRGLASRLAGVESGLQGSLRSMTFDGPAGDDFRARLGTVGDRLGSFADELHSLASTLETSATEVEAQIRERDRLLEQLRREQAEAAAGVS